MSAQPEGSGVQAPGPLGWQTLGWTATPATLRWQSAFGELTAAISAASIRISNLQQHLTERHDQMTETVTVNGISYPLEPNAQSGFNRLSAPGSVERRWQRVTTTAYPEGIDFLYMGICGACSNPTWKNFDDTFPVEDHIGRQVIHAEMVADEDHDTTVAICFYCKGRSRESMALTTRRSDPDTYSDKYAQWPDAVVDEIKARIKKHQEKGSKYVEARPTVPVVGAYVLVNGERFLRFESFDEKGKVRASGNSYDLDKVQVVIPLVHGTLHPEVIGLPGSGRDGQRYRVLRYSNIHAVVRSASGSNETVACNSVGVIAPIVNPATESVEEAKARLEYVFQRLQDALHHRMVAEGTHRNWCGEFDPILDSVGLPPRTGKQVVTMVMRVESAGTPPTEANLMERGWENYYNYSHLRCVSAVIEEPSSNPLLSA